MLWLLLSGCASSQSSAPQQPLDAWDGAREIVEALPPLGHEKWTALTPEQQNELVKAAGPFLMKWNSEADRRVLSVILATFSAMWNARTPAPPVHCTLLEHIVCY